MNPACNQSSDRVQEGHKVYQTRLNSIISIQKCSKAPSSYVCSHNPLISGTFRPLSD